MNPTTLAQPAPPMVNDVSKPSQPAAAAPQTLTTNIVNNIPVHAPAHPLPPPVNEDDELDKIMRDVGRQLRQAERQTPKKHLFHRHKTKPITTAVAMTVPAVEMPPRPDEAGRPAEQHAAVKMNLRPDTPVKPSAAITHSSPILLVFLTAAVTFALMAAAIYTYRLS